MKTVIRTAAAVAAFTVAGLGLAGVSSAAEGTGYVPDSCTAMVDGVTTAVSCAEVEGVQVEAASAATTTSGSLPYTGSNSSIVLAEVGVALVAVGGGVLLVVKRRHSADRA